MSTSTPVAADRFLDQDRRDEPDPHPLQVALTAWWSEPGAPDLGVPEHRYTPKRSAVDPTVDHSQSRHARGPVRLVAALIISMLAALGLVVPTASAHAHVGTVIAVTTTADDAQHAGSVDATADSLQTRSTRRRRSVRVADAVGRLVRALGRLGVTSWTVPARIVGGVPPGRAPPATSTPLAGVAPFPA